MKRRPFIHLALFVTILLITGLACQAVTDIFEEDSGYYDESYEDGYDDEYESDFVGEDKEDTEKSTTDSNNLPTDTEEPTTGNICPVVMGNILSAATQVEDDPDSEYAEEPENQYLVTYEISGDQINDPVYESVSSDLQSYQDDTAAHQQIWTYFVTLIPAGERNSLAEYSIVTDGEGEGLAAVTQTTYDPALWGLEIDIRDSDDKLNLTYTLIHEYAHLLTLGPEQVTPSEAVFNNPDDDNIYFDEVSACPDYFPGEGCSRSDSYINAFFNQFWEDIHEEWQDINLIEDDDSYYKALDDFYFKYEERFVTDYAATNPEEDIAETFTFFILSPQPNDDTITGQKILFFYKYPEIIQLRDEILRGVCQLIQ